MPRRTWQSGLQWRSRSWLDTLSGSYLQYARRGNQGVHGRALRKLFTLPAGAWTSDEFGCCDDRRPHAEFLAMATTQDKPQVMPLGERRSGNDRRHRDELPPTDWERRRSLEPRKPEVLDLEITPSQWDALQREAFPGASDKP